MTASPMTISPRAAPPKTSDELLPNPPTGIEKFSYFGGRNRWLLLYLFLSFCGVTYAPAPRRPPRHRDDEPPLKSPFHVVTVSGAVLVTVNGVQLHVHCASSLRESCWQHSWIST